MSPVSVYGGSKSFSPLLLNLCIAWNSCTHSAVVLVKQPKWGKSRKKFVSENILLGQSTLSNKTAFSVEELVIQLCS